MSDIVSSREIINDELEDPSQSEIVTIPSQPDLPLWLIFQPKVTVPFFHQPSWRYS